MARLSRRGQPSVTIGRTAGHVPPDSAVTFCRNTQEIIWRNHGWQELAGEPLPGTIGAEGLEWEQQEVEV